MSEDKLFDESDSQGFFALCYVRYDRPRQKVATPAEQRQQLEKLAKENGFDIAFNESEGESPE